MSNLRLPLFTMSTDRLLMRAAAVAYLRLAAVTDGDDAKAAHYEREQLRLVRAVKRRRAGGS